MKVHGGVRVCKVMIEDIFGVKARVGNLMIRQDLPKSKLNSVMELTLSIQLFSLGP